MIHPVQEVQEADVKLQTIFKSVGGGSQYENKNCLNLQFSNQFITRAEEDTQIKVGELGFPFDCPFKDQICANRELPGTESGTHCRIPGNRARTLGRDFGPIGQKTMNGGTEGECSQGHWTADCELAS